MATACACHICDSYRATGNKAKVAREVGIPRSTVFDHIASNGRGTMGQAATSEDKTAMPPESTTPPPHRTRVLNPGGGLIEHVGPAGTVLGLFDLHLPWVHRRAFDAMLDYAGGLKPDLLILGGDILDCHSLSKHEKDPFRTFQAEADESRPYLERLARIAPRTIYLEGNHEHRCARLALEKPELMGLRAMELPAAAGLPTAWSYYASQTHYRIGGPDGLTWLHGDLAGGPRSGNGAAHRLRTRLATSVIFGHFHADSVAPHATSYSGEIEREGHAVGWLGDVTRAGSYVTCPAWNISFVTAYFGTAPGDWCVEHHAWKRGAFRIHGKRYA